MQHTIIILTFLFLAVLFIIIATLVVIMGFWNFKKKYGNSFKNKKEIFKISKKLGLEGSIRSNLDSFILVDLTGRILETNKNFRELLGYTKEELESFNYNKLSPQKWNKQEGEIINNIINSGQSPLWRKEYIKKDGSLLNVEIKGYLVKDKSEKPMAVWKFIRDITREREVEGEYHKILNELQEKSQKLEKEKLKLESLLESIGDGIVATDQDGRIIRVNKSAEIILGWTVKEIKSQYAVDFLKVFNKRDQEIPVYKNPMVVALSYGTKAAVPLGETYYFLTKEGKKIPVDLTVTPFIYSDKIIGCVLVFRDVTVEKNIEQAKNEYISIVSHELRSPLTSMRVFLEMLLNEKAGSINEKQEKYLKIISESINSMIDLVKDFLNVSRLESGELKLKADNLDLENFVRNIVNEFSSLAKSKKCSIVLKKFNLSVPHVYMPPILVRQIIHNLLSNAIRYSPEKSKIKVSIELVNNKNKDLILEEIQPKKAKYENENSNGNGVELIKEYVLITIQDQGMGIPEEDQDKIFTKFFRANNAKEKVSEGSGLGLYITKKIAESLGGHIGFKSQLSKGATFYTFLPIKQKKDSSI